MLSDFWISDLEEELAELKANTFGMPSQCRTPAASRQPPHHQAQMLQMRRRNNLFSISSELDMNGEWDVVVDSGCDADAAVQLTNQTITVCPGHPFVSSL